MKVILVASQLAGYGGISRMMVLYLKALRDLYKDADVVVISHEDTQPIVNALLARVNIPRVVGFGVAKSDIHLSDLILAHSYGVANIVCGHIKLLPLIPPGIASVSLVAHGSEVWGPVSHTERHALMRVDHVLCVSDYTCSQMQAVHSQCADKCTIVHGALEPELWTPEYIPPPTKKMKLLCVSRLDMRDMYKGIAILIDAMSELGDYYKLDIVGGGDAMPYYQRMIDKHRMRDRVRLIGNVTDAQLRTLYQSCNCFVLPSMYEGFGIVHLEALAAGRPVIGFNGAATPELIQPECGVLIDVLDVPTLKSAIRKAYYKTFDGRLCKSVAAKYSYDNLLIALRNVWQLNNAQAAEA